MAVFSPAATTSEIFLRPIQTSFASELVVVANSWLLAARSASSSKTSKNGAGDIAICSDKLAERLLQTIRSPLLRPTTSGSREGRGDVSI